MLRAKMKESASIRLAVFRRRRQELRKKNKQKLKEGKHDDDSSDEEDADLTGKGGGRRRARAFFLTRWTELQEEGFLKTAVESVIVKKAEKSGKLPQLGSSKIRREVRAWCALATQQGLCFDATRLAAIQREIEELVELVEKPMVGDIYIWNTFTYLLTVLLANLLLLTYLLTCLLRWAMSLSSTLGVRTRFSTQPSGRGKGRKKIGVETL